MDSMTGDSLIIFLIYKGALSRIAHAKLNGFLNGYFSNGFKDVDVIVTLLDTTYAFKLYVTFMQLAPYRYMDRLMVLCVFSL